MAVKRTLSSSSLSLHFNDHFPGESGLVGFIEAKDDGSGGDNWSYKTCKAPVKSSPPTNQHPMFYRPDYSGHREQGSDACCLVRGKSLNELSE